MLTYFLQFDILLTAWMLAQCQGCGSKWFGKNCEFLCHCLNSQKCDIKGNCPDNEQCEKGFFGPGCQYVDVLQANTSVGLDQSLRDWNDTTCNPKTDGKVVSVSFIEPVLFTWFRLALKNKENMLNFTTTLNDEEACKNERKFPVSETLVDLSCDRATMNKLKISGAAVGSLCSIYISGGRNVAIKQTATQSSDYIVYASISAAQNGVDGDTNNDFSMGHCTHTEILPLPVWWSLTFSEPQILYRVVNYNRVNFEHRLRKFYIETFDKDNATISVYNKSYDTGLLTYEFSIYSQQPVTFLRLTKIQTSETQYSDDSALTLCEVQTFGDRVCPLETYGFYCESCRCNLTDTCHPISGVCALGCQTGFYGWNCSSRCGKCLHNVCAFSSGDCIQCPPGYLGAKCDKACSKGTFGPNCLLNCSKQCTNVCDSKKGNCSCQAGFGGGKCAACKQGTFGPNCRSKCSKHCTDVCDRKNGNCSCQAGFGGAQCAACNKDTYGPNCRFNCSKRCINACDSKTGNCRCPTRFAGEQCTECAATWYGLNCEKRCSGFCGDMLCDNLTGECLTCPGRRLGNYCRECPVRYHGPLCTTKCNTHCLNGTCDQMSGKCFACEEDYKGSLCLEKQTSFYPYLTPFVLLYFLLLLCLLACTERLEDEEEDDNRQQQPINPL